MLWTHADYLPISWDTFDHSDYLCWVELRVFNNSRSSWNSWLFIGRFLIQPARMEMYSSPSWFTSDAISLTCVELVRRNVTLATYLLVRAASSRSCNAWVICWSQSSQGMSKSELLSIRQYIVFEEFMQLTSALKRKYNAPRSWPRAVSTITSSMGSICRISTCGEKISRAIKLRNIAFGPLWVISSWSLCRLQKKDMKIWDVSWSRIDRADTHRTNGGGVLPAPSILQ